MTAEGRGATTELRRKMGLIEQGLSNIGSDQRRTREWYKDNQKHKAFHDMVTMASSATSAIQRHPTALQPVFRFA